MKDKALPLEEFVASLEGQEEVGGEQEAAQ